MYRSVLYQAFSYARARTICTDQYCVRPSAMLGLGQYVQISTVLGPQLCQDQDNMYRSVLCQAFSYARARTICTDQYCVRPSAMLGLGQYVQISTVLGLQLCQGQDNMYRSVLCQAFSYARARTICTDQYCVRPSAMLGLGQYVQISTVLGLQLCQGQDNMYRSVLCQAFSYARARTICTDQYCIRPSAMLGLGQWVEQCNLTMLGFPLEHQAKIIIRQDLVLSHPLLSLVPLLASQCLAFVTSQKRWQTVKLLHSRAQSVIRAITFRGYNLSSPY